MEKRTLIRHFSHLINLPSKHRSAGEKVATHASHQITLCSIWTPRPRPHPPSRVFP